MREHTTSCSAFACSFSFGITTIVRMSRNPCEEILWTSRSLETASWSEHRGQKSTLRSATRDTIIIDPTPKGRATVGGEDFLAFSGMLMHDERQNLRAQTVRQTSNMTRPLTRAQPFRVSILMRNGSSSTLNVTARVIVR